MSDATVYRITVNGNAGEYIRSEYCVGNAAWAGSREQAESLVRDSIEAFEGNHVVDDDDNPCIPTEDDYSIEEYRLEWLDDAEQAEVLDIVARQAQAQ